MTPPGTSVQSAKEASRVAEAYAEGTIAVLNHRRADPAAAHVLDRIVAGATDTRAYTMQDRARVIATIGQETADHLGLVGLTAAAVRMWQARKIVYRMHPALAQSLFETDTSTHVPCDVFARLPHPDPFVAFPTPIATPIPDPAQPLVDDPQMIGMLVVGRNGRGELCSTHDPRVAGLHLQLAARVQYVGQDVTYEESTLHLPLRGQATVEELGQRYLRGAGRDDDDELQKATLRGCRLAVSLLLYLCSDRSDVQTSSSSSPRGGRQRQRAATVVDVGYHVGPKLLAATRPPSPASGTGAGQSVRPHLRRAHWHTYWTGPRTDQTAVLRWLHPVLVHPDEPSDGKPTVVAVT